MRNLSLLLIEYIYFQKESSTMTEKYETVEIADKGRGIVAKEDLKEDFILFDEKPVCSAQFSWGRHLGYKACFHCMRPVETPTEAIQRLTIYGLKIFIFLTM